MIAEVVFGQITPCGAAEFFIHDVGVAGHPGTAWDVGLFRRTGFLPRVWAVGSAHLVWNPLSQRLGSSWFLSGVLGT